MRQWWLPFSGEPLFLFFHGDQDGRHTTVLPALDPAALSCDLESVEGPFDGAPVFEGQPSGTGVCSPGRLLGELGMTRGGSSSRSRMGQRRYSGAMG